MIHKISYKRTLSALGRNGHIKQSGIEVMNREDSHQGHISLSPITSKGDIGRCEIEIPIEDLQQVIDALEQVSGTPIKNQFKETPEYNEIINDLLITAMEGGSNYWYGIEEKLLPDNKEAKGIYPSDVVIKHKGELIIGDVEGLDDTLGKVTLDRCYKALELVLINDPEMYVRIMTGDYDASDADVFFQYAVMKEVVYG